MSGVYANHIRCLRRKRVEKEVQKWFKNAEKNFIYGDDIEQHNSSQVNNFAKVINNQEILLQGLKILMGDKI